MASLACSRCNKPRETSDNFCRNCGHQFTVNLPSVPAVREARLPARSSRSLPPSLVGSVAVLALGTGLEWLARRMAGSAARAAGRALVGTDRTPATTNHRSQPEPVDVDEILYIRRVQSRR